MDEKHINEILEKLKNRELTEYFVQKEDFLAFRKEIVKREDFKYFKGIAQRGGAALYQYMDIPRS